MEGFTRFLHYGIVAKGRLHPLPTLRPRVKNGVQYSFFKVRRAFARTGASSPVFAPSFIGTTVL